MTEVGKSVLPRADIDRHAFDVLLAESSNARVGVNPEGGYITSWQVRNPQGEFEDILYQGSIKKRTGIPTLFPYFGNADGMRSHGFGRDSLWQVVLTESNRITLALGNEDIPEDARLEYPYPFGVEMTVEAEEDGSLLYKLKVMNTGTSNLPISPGLHPYWAIAHKDKAVIQIEGISDFDASQVDWDKQPPDAVYDYRGKTVIKMLGREIEIEDVTDGVGVVKYLVVWSQTPQKDDSDFICVEPVTGKDNAVKEKPILVAPGEDWEMAIKFSVTLQPAE